MTTNLTVGTVDWIVLAVIAVMIAFAIKIIIGFFK